MRKPEIVMVNLRNGDSGLFVNGNFVHADDAGDRCFDLLTLGNNLATSLGVTAHAVEMDPPAGGWNWPDVYKLLPTFQAQPDIVPVAHWNSSVYVGEGGEPDNGKPYLIEVGDLRQASGQVFIDVAPESGMVELATAVAVEVHSLAGIEGDMPCVHLHFDESNLAASFFKQGDRFIVRPETGVRLASTVLPNGEHVWILE